MFAFGIVAVISIVFYGILSNTGLEGAKKRVRETGRNISAEISREGLSADEAKSILNNYSLESGFYVFLFGMNGENLIEDNSFDEEVLSVIWQTLESNTGEWRNNQTYEYTTRNGGKAVFHSVNCLLYGGTQAKLVVRYPVGPVGASISSVELIMLLIALGAMVIAFFISYSLANKLSSPLREVAGTAKKLAHGDYSVQFSSAQYAEIATLSDSLNYMKDEMKKNDDFKKQLLANVSHDLKTPLTMIKAYASMIKEISGDDKVKREKHLQVIIDESDRLTGLVNDILSASKITAGLQDLNKKVLNLTELLYSVINKFAYLQETQGYSIMVDVTPNLYTQADEEKIQQVIYNLVSNAVNYTGEDKTVYISLKDDLETGKIKFNVRDTGKGIEEDELEHIWDRYYRSKDSHVRPVKGTGLGLNIVKNILEAHGFNYGVNTKLGEGSSFYVYFPSVPSTPEDMQVNDEKE
ncbi:MAG: ATP-binding protein [Candidatus Coproplasma sp.]